MKGVYQNVARKASPFGFTEEQALAIIAERYTVPKEVRREQAERRAERKEKKRSRSR